MKLTKSQLQFFFDEVLEKLDWCEEIEETTVDPLDYVLDEINNMKRHIVRLEKSLEMRTAALEQDRGLTPREPDNGDSAPSQAFSTPDFLSDLEGLS